MKNFNDILRYLMNKDRIKQRELAKEMHVSIQTISAWVVGRTEPNIGQLIDLSNFFGITVGQLIGIEKLDEEFVILNERDIDSYLVL